LAVAARLGPETAVVDTENIALDHAFPRVPRDGVLDARLVVVFVTPAYSIRRTRAVMPTDCQAAPRVPAEASVAKDSPHSRATPSSIRAR